MKGFGGRSVLEIASSYDGNTWRAVYTVRFEDAVYVLHAFQKKSEIGHRYAEEGNRPHHKRLADAERDHTERQN